MLDYIQRKLLCINSLIALYFTIVSFTPTCGRRSKIGTKHIAKDPCGKVQDCFHVNPSHSTSVLFTYKPPRARQSLKFDAYPHEHSQIGCTMQQSTMHKQWCKKTKGLIWCTWIWKSSKSAYILKTACGWCCNKWCRFIGWQCRIKQWNRHCFHRCCCSGIDTNISTCRWHMCWIQHARWITCSWLYQHLYRRSKHDIERIQFQEFSYIYNDD